MFQINNERNLPSLFGLILFIGMMAAGYYFNLTFVQLGLEDFGSRQLGLNPSVIAGYMAMLAVGTSLVALAFGWWMRVQRLARRFRFKLKAVAGVVAAQTLLTISLPIVQDSGGFLFWLLCTAAVLGIGVPATFSLAVDLVPVRARGLAAALITALSYFAAETLSSSWTYEFFRERALWVLAPGTVGIAVLALIRHPWLDALALQHRDPQFAQGRFVRSQSESKSRFQAGVLQFVVLMFAVYFIDSLGFLRLLKVPGFMQVTWQSPLLSDRLFISGIHLIGAVIGGLLYDALSERQLFFWIFGLFALTHLQYSLHLRTTGDTLVTLATPMLYALAVSLYTVVNFAIWADLSTPDTISFNAALGVALSAWTATFLSTALALYWQGQGLSLVRHIQIVNALALLLFLALLMLAFFRKPERIS